MLLRRFRAERNAVLVATMSFWEGVDVPGDALRLVVIDKLPFAVPTDPVVAARCRALEERGAEPLPRLQRPRGRHHAEAGLRPAHPHAHATAGSSPSSTGGCARAGYGAALLAVLPPARRTDKLADVQAFWEGVKG